MDGVTARIASGQAVALVTNAGMPAVSDPGTRIVAGCRRAGLPVTVVPGPSAVTAAVALSALGNPGNMGFCIACFLRDIAGATKLHTAGAVQYARPEIAGLVLGACIAAIAFKEWKPRGGSTSA